VLRVGPIWKTADPIADAKAAHERPSGVGAWGEGLVDRSLTTLWYPGDWSEVSDDELVFMLPTLSTWRPGSAGASTRGSDGPLRYLTRVIAARALATAALISSSGTAPGASPAQALELLMARGILTAVPLEDLTAPTFGTYRGPRLPISPASRVKRPAGQLPDWLALELTALAHLDRLLRDARANHEGDAPAPLVDWPLTLADVVLVTVNARLNGLYVPPEFAHAHELLMAAALLGHLACGRAAYLPPAVAQSLADVLSGRVPTAGEKDWCASIFRLYADLAGGAEYTLALARRAAASGRPCLVRPPRPSAPSDIGRTTWNARLLQRIGERWQVSA